MQAQSVTLDFLKPVGTVVDLSDKFNVRVGDSMTLFNLFVTEGGKPKVLNGLHPELEAAVGDGELKDGKVVMSDNAKGIHWVGNADNVTGYNRLTLTFPAEVFPQSGFCYGHLILANDAGVRESSVDIWFKVLDGLEIMGLAADYYDSAIELELKKLEEANSQAEQRLSEMNLQPEMYADLDAVKAAYPNGATKLIATDDGYLALYRNGQWIKGPIFQAAGISDGSVGSKQVSTISASKIIDNQLNPLGAEGQGNINVVGNNEYVMIVSDEVQTATSLVGTFIPLSITSEAPLILTAKVKSSLDTGYNQPLWLADKNKTVLRQVGYVAIPDKGTSVNVKQSFNITEDPGEYYLLITSKAVGVVTYYNLTINESGTPSSTIDKEIKEINDLTTKINESMVTTVGNKQVSTISASKIVDNQLSPSEAEGQGNINVVGNNEYVMITSNEVNTALKSVFTSIPLVITSKEPLILTARIMSSLDAGYTQPIFIADKNKTILRQLSNVNVSDKSTSINVKMTLTITEDPGNYYLLIPSQAIGIVTYYNLTINAIGLPSSTVDKEIKDLTTKIDESPTVRNRAFDTIVNNDVQLDKVSATDGIELTRDLNTFTAKVNKAHSAEETQAIFFPVHVQTRNAEFAVTVKVAPIKFPGTYTQQIYLADAERNIGELLGTFPVNSQASADFKVNLPASQDFCIALIASVTGTFEFELTVNDSTGRNDVDLAKYTTWLDSGTYDHARMNISRIDYSNMNPKTIDGVEYVSPYHTFGVDNGRLNAIYVWTEKAGTYSFCVGKLDQNNLIVDGKYFELQLAKGFNSIGMNIRTDSASNLFMKITDGVSLYEGNQAIKVQTSGQHINSGVYSGDYFQDNHGVLPFGYDVTSLSPTDRIIDVEEQQRQNTASIAQLKGATILTANNGAKYKLVVADDGTLSTKNMTPSKVRVFGNSLTETTEEFGLAASDPQHDYYYLMSQYILGKNPKADIQRQGMVAWEWSTNSSDRQKAFDDWFKPHLDTDTDLVIIQCMENVNSVASKKTLAQDSITLLQNIKKCSPNAQIIWMYGWWGDHTVFDPAQNACDKVGSKGINLNDIGTQKSMQSYAGQKRTLKDGTVRKIQENEASHPGDAGMKAIADRLIANFDF